MSFAEKIKLEVKRKAGFQCCRCHETGIDIHHIISQVEEGNDEIDNAAPLCQNCHDKFGANPEKRKEIRQMRDWWYEVISEKYPVGKNLEFLNKLSEINELLLKGQKEQETSISSIKQELTKKIEELKTASIPGIKDGSSVIQQKVSNYISAVRLADRIHANFQCKKCGTYIGLLIGSNECPSCHEPIQ